MLYAISSYRNSYCIFTAGSNSQIEHLISNFVCTPLPLCRLNAVEENVHVQNLMDVMNNTITVILANENTCAPL